MANEVSPVKTEPPAPSRFVGTKDEIEVVPRGGE